MTSYADHDVQHILHNVRFRRQGDSGGTDSYADERQFNITERGLDPDELAELRAARIDVAALQLPAEGGSAQDQEAAFRAAVDAGFNLTGTEFLGNTADASQDLIDNDNSGTDDYFVVTRDTDEVGQVYTTLISGAPTTLNATDGTGSGGIMETRRELIDFGELTEGGPVVDSADDWTSRVELSINNIVETVGVSVRYSLYYAVEESEGGRTRFGR